MTFATTPKKIPEKFLVKMIPSEDNHFFANLDNKQEEEGCNSFTSERESLFKLRNQNFLKEKKLRGKFCSF